jgi:hypothetical protein
MNARASASRIRAAISVWRVLGCALWRVLGCALWRVLGCAVLALGLASLIAVQGSAHVARRGAPALDVQPFPGTPDASPQTDIEFPALAPSELVSVSVAASRSGPHPGRLASMPTRQGAEFIPDRPFVSGDRVSVRARLRDGTPISFSFGVVAPLQRTIGPSAPANPATASPDTAYVMRHDIRDTSTWTHTFHSIGWIHPPLVWMNGTDPDPRSSGDIFADVHRTYVQAGPLILNPVGQLVWFNPLPNRQAAFNTEMQTYKGNQVLTYWEGYSGGGYGNGYDVILDHHYQTVATVHAGDGYQADLHEFQILPNGDALITAYADIPNVNLTSVGGPKSGVVIDNIIQEVNIATGHVDWEWHAYGHVDLRETYAGKPSANTKTNPYDFFHINSVQMLPNGNLLVSARNMWTVYEINMQTGKIPYNFGGKNYWSFKFEPGANYEWQHDATMQPDGTMTVFDDADGNYKSESQSRALRLSINYSTHRLSLVHAYTHNPGLLASSQGSVQVLSDGNTFVGWGAEPYMTEFWKRTGQQRFNLHYSPPMESYRAYRFNWWGQPLTPPNIATAATSQGTRVYASWNGATDVASWRVLAGPSATQLVPVGTFPKTGFETKMWVRNAEPYFAVQALGSGGGARSTSATVSRGSAG